MNRRTEIVRLDALRPLGLVTEADIAALAEERLTESLALSIKSIGLLNPLLLLETEEGGEKVLYIAGGYRRIAALRYILRQTEAPATICVAENPAMILDALTRESR